MESPTSSSSLPSSKSVLDPSQIEAYLQDGVLVVENVLSRDELEQARNGLMESLRKRGVESFDANDDESAMAFQKLSSTNGSGGVLDIFHDGWKLHVVATHPKLFAITQELWKAGHGLGGQPKDSIAEDEQYQWHPYGDVDFENKGYCYIDRIGYRLPTELAQEWGDRIHRRNTNDKSATATSKKKKKLRSVQRSLTPHLDCCPDTLYENNQKWRPIQCFVSLTDNLEANTGGFEAVLGGFHQKFDQWAQTRNIESAESAPPAPCLGEYTHIRPKEDYEVMKRVVHIPVKAGSAVFWDNRIPHANAYRNDHKSLARAVVYASFLPDIELNRRYVQNQLQAWKLRQPIRDQWNHIPEEKGPHENDESEISPEEESLFTDLGNKLMGITPW